MDSLATFHQEKKGKWNLSTQHMVSSGKSEGGKSGDLMLPWFKFPPPHQSRNKITQTSLNFYFGFPFPFHFQSTGRLRINGKVVGDG